METNIPSAKPAGGKTAGWLILCLAAGVAATLLWPAYLVLPALWAAGMLRARPAWLVAFAAVMLGAAYFLWGDWLTALCLTALAALPALAICLLQKRRVENVYTAAVAAGLSLLAMYGLVCLPGLLSGEGAFEPLRQAFAAAAADMKQTLSALPDPTGRMHAAWNEYLDLFVASVPTLIVPTLCGVSCVLALANLLFFRLFLKGRDMGLAPLRPFWDWGIPRSLTIGLALLLVASLVASFTKWEFAAGFSATANVIVGFPLAVQGLSTLDFFMRRSPRATLVRTLVYIAVGLLFSLLQSVLILLGCCEQVFRVRERFREAAAQRPR